MRKYPIRSTYKSFFSCNLSNNFYFPMVSLIEQNLSKRYSYVKKIKFLFLLEYYLS